METARSKASGSSRKDCRCSRSGLPQLIPHPAQIPIWTESSYMTGRIATTSDPPLAHGDPAISVIIPVYNGASVLNRCLARLSTSCDAIWECIVVDDGSTDGSAEVARAAGAQIIGL